MMKQFVLIICLLVCPFAFCGERTMPVTLAEAVSRARVNSVDAAVALDELRSAYWQYRSYRAELLPEISFSATLPSYHRQFSPYMNGDGGYSFVSNNYLEMTGQFNVTQNIWLTGGKVSLVTSADFLRQFGNDSYSRFMSVPVALTLSQPVFGVNSIKWDRRIEPVRFREAKAKFLSDSEEVAMQAISYYFQLLMAHENVAISVQNLENAEKLFEVAKEKRKMGTISGNDLLQMELNVLDARSQLTEHESECRNAMFSLRSFLDLDENADIVPVVPDSVPYAEISYGVALEKALENNKLAHSLRRRQLEADYAVAKMKGDLREINIFAQIGLTGTSSTFPNAYRGLKNNQVVEIGVEIPLVDWGKRRGKVKVAESNRNVELSRLKKENMEFSQNLFILVERYGNQRQQLELSRRANDISSRRYETNVETYMIGRISTLDLDDSRVKKDEARREYIRQMYLFWYYYYQLRSVTLWDFANDCGIDADFNALFR